MTKTTVTPKKREQLKLKAAYMHTFGAVATDRSEVAAALGVSPATATKLLKETRRSMTVASDRVYAASSARQHGPRGVGPRSIASKRSPAVTHACHADRGRRSLQCRREPDRPLPVLRDAP
jgi:hypothetical protein